ncbi:hypothetical protein N9B54_01635 [Mariniblastus sp.]|nr:hypothetical protein [Mariniblastus sp.]
MGDTKSAFAASLLSPRVLPPEIFVSFEAHFTGGVEVAGSNPVSPTFFQSRKHAVFNRLMFKRATLQGELRGDFTS